MKKNFSQTLLFCTGLAVMMLSQIEQAPCPPFGELQIDDQSVQHMGTVIYKVDIDGYHVGGFDGETKQNGGTISSKSSTRNTRAGANIRVVRNHGILFNNLTEYKGTIPFSTNDNEDIIVTLKEGGRVSVTKMASYEKHLKDAKRSVEKGIASYPKPGGTVVSGGHALSAVESLGKAHSKIQKEFGSK